MSIEPKWKGREGKGKVGKFPKCLSFLLEKVARSDGYMRGEAGNP